MLTAGGGRRVPGGRPLAPYAFHRTGGGVLSFAPRPDGHVAWTPPGDLRTALRTWFGPGPA